MGMGMFKVHFQFYHFFNSPLNYISNSNFNKSIRNYQINMSKQNTPIRSQSNPQYHQYIIIGAGISGFTAAEILAQNQKDFLMIQAANKPGGRICTDYLGQIIENMGIDYQWVQNQFVKKVPVQSGATWISKEHSYIIHLTRQFGLNLFPQYFDGLSIYGLDDGNYQRIQSMAQHYKVHQKKISKLLDKIDNLTINLEKIEENKAANKQLYNQYINFYDSMKLSTFISEQLQDPQLVDNVCREIQTLQCMTCDKVSTLQFIEDSGSLELLRLYAEKIDDTIDGLKVKQGMMSIIRKLEQKINNLLDQQEDNEYNIYQRNSGFLRLSSPITQIINEITSQVVVKTRAGEYFSCRKVFFSVPIAVAHNIKFSRISPGKKLILDNQQYGKVTRKYYVFKEAFWRDKFSGYGSFNSKFDFNQLTELSPSNLACGMLAFVFVGETYQNFRLKIKKQAEENQQNAQVKQDQYFKRIIGDMFNVPTNSDAFKESITFHKTFTYNQFIRAAYQSTTKPKVWAQIQALGDDYKQCYSRDEYNVVYIGSQFGDEYATYMEGAIRVARKKVHNVLGIKDTLKVINPYQKNGL